MLSGGTVSKGCMKNCLLCHVIQFAHLIPFYARDKCTHTYIFIYIPALISAYLSCLPVECAGEEGAVSITPGKDKFAAEVACAKVTTKVKQKNK